MKALKHCISLIALAGIPFSLVAQNHSKQFVASRDTTHYETKSVETLDEVIVTASRTPRFHKDIPVLTQVIPQHQIRMIEPRSFTEILEFSLPGVEFNKHGGQDNLSYRGFSGQSILFLVDGELVTTGSTGTIDFDRIDPDNIEKVEIIRGAASALYGSNALAGVVNIITKSSKKNFYASALGSADIFTKDKKAIVGQRYWGNVALNKDDGFGSYTSLGFNHAPGYSIVDEDGTSNIVFDTNRINFGQKFTFKPSKNFAIRTGVNYNHRVQNKDEFLDNRFVATDATLGAVWLINKTNSVDLSYHLNNFNRDSVMLLLDNEKRNVFMEFLHHLRLQYNFDYGTQHLLNIGGELIHDKIYSPRLQSPESPGAKTVQTGIVYGQYSYEPFKQLSLSYGGRLDMRSNFGSHYTNRVTVKYRPVHELILRASFAQGYRTPSMQELYFFFDHQGMFFLYGNEKLKPEKSNMFLLSGEYNNRFLSVSANAFYNIVRNRIGMMQIKGGFQYANAPASDKKNKLYGVDVNMRAKLPWGVALTASYSYSYDYITLVDNEGKAIVNEKGQNVLATSTRPHAAVGMLSWEYNRPNYGLSVNLAVRFLSGFKSGVRTGDKTYEILSYNAATIGKLGLCQKFFKNYELYLGVDNLFGYQPNKVAYNTPLTPGRTYLATVRLRY